MSVLGGWWSGVTGFPDLVIHELCNDSDAFGLRHWANGAEYLPRAHFSENSAPVMAHWFSFGRTFWKLVRPTFHMFFIFFENIISRLTGQLVFFSYEMRYAGWLASGKIRVFHNQFWNPGKSQNLALFGENKGHIMWYHYG